MKQEFTIKNLMDFTRQNKYATAVAGFEVIDMIDRFELPKRLLKSKPAVRSMRALSENLVQWEYIGDLARNDLRKELGLLYDKETEEEPSTLPIELDVQQQNVQQEATLAEAEQGEIAINDDSVEEENDDDSAEDDGDPNEEVD